MAKRDVARKQRRQDALTRDSDGELRLALHDGHLEHAPIAEDLEAAERSETQEVGLPNRASASADLLTPELRSVEAANRARLVALHHLRSPAAPVDFRDAFFGGLWLAFFLVFAGVAGWVFLQLDVLWAAGLAFAAGVLGGTAVITVLERRDQKAIRELEKSIAAPPPRPKFHWRSVTPAALYRRIGADLDAINIDDTTLEDELEPLYEHGNKMDNGWSGGWR